MMGYKVTSLGKEVIGKFRSLEEIQFLSNKLIDLGKVLSYLIFEQVKDTDEEWLFTYSSSFEDKDGVPPWFIDILLKEGLIEESELASTWADLKAYKEADDRLEVLRKDVNDNPELKFFHIRGEDFE